MLSWEIGHGQAQASLIGFQLSLCLSLVLVLGHVQLMLTHPLDTHTLRSLMIWATWLWFDYMMWLYCNSAFVDWLGLPGAYWLLIGIMLSACSCLLVNWSVLQLGAQLGKWLCMEMVVQLWVQMASMVWSSGELRHSCLINSIDTWSQFDLSYMGSHLGSCWKVCVCLTSS